MYHPNFEQKISIPGEQRGINLVHLSLLASSKATNFYNLQFTISERALSRLILTPGCVTQCYIESISLRLGLGTGDMMGDRKES